MNAEYRIELTNEPYNGLRQFDCSQQGLVRLYGWLCVGSLLLLLWIRARLGPLTASSEASASQQVCCILWLSSFVFSMIHLLLYKRDGLGVASLVYVSGLCECVCWTLLCGVFCSWAMGPLTAEPQQDISSYIRDDHSKIWCLAGVFGGTLLLYVLAEAEFSYNPVPHPMGIQLTSLPHLLARIHCTYQVSRHLQLVRMERDPESSHKQRIFRKLMCSLILFWFIFPVFLAILQSAIYLTRDFVTVIQFVGNALSLGGSVWLYSHPLFGLVVAQKSQSSGCNTAHPYVDL